MKGWSYDYESYNFWLDSICHGQNKLFPPTLANGMIGLTPSATALQLERLIAQHPDLGIFSLKD
jgi:hypothetical protein